MAYCSGPYVYVILNPPAGRAETYGCINNYIVMNMNVNAFTGIDISGKRINLKIQGRLCPFFPN